MVDPRLPRHPAHLPGPAAPRIALFTGGLLASADAKTAHGLLRYGDDNIVAVIDPLFAGRRADDVVPFVTRPVPVVANIAAALRLGAETLVIGVAPDGGELTPEWREIVLDAVRSGMGAEAGLHSLLTDDPELVAIAAATGATLRDLRSVPADLGVSRAVVEPRQAVVIHTVGSDCAIGKMTTALELHHAARALGHASVFVPTGQTGIAIAGWGIAVDHVIADYVAGAAERLVSDGASRGDLLWVEGQGSLFHPAYSGVTLSLLHGTRPDLLILCHRARSEAIAGYPDAYLPSLPDIVAVYETAAAWVAPTRVAAIALDTSHLDADAAQAAIAGAEAVASLPVDDVVRFGADRLLQLILEAVPARTETAPPRSASAFSP